MTAGARIVLNTLATYGRSVVSLVLGLFSARWVLAALGKDDFGLYGVVGTMIVVVSLLNGIMSGAVSRYYAFAIGEAEKTDAETGRDLVNRWFNAALFIHTILPIILILIGYPIGIYAIHHWLVIPSARIDASVWVFRLALFSAFINMVSVPYVAMYRAKQLIAELSFWGVLTTVVTFVCAYILLSWEGDRLIAYAGYMTILPAAIILIQVYRARVQFGVCHVCLRYLFVWSYIKKLFIFAFGEFFGWVGGAIRDNGMAFLINIKFGTGMNAAYNIANQVSGQTTSLSSAMIGALMPAVTSAEGAGDHDRAVRLSFQSIKFGVILILLFCIPLILEIDEVLRLWLVTPPENTAVFCCCILVSLICHKLGWGHHLAILAHGKIVAYQTTVGITGSLGLALAWVLVEIGLGAFGIGISFAIIYSIMTVERVFFARLLCGMSIRYWLTKVVVPIFVVVAVTFVAGWLVRVSMPTSVVRVLITSVTTSVLLLLCCWFMVCEADERMMMRMFFLSKVLKKRIYQR